jgi:hypothetical protein
MALFFFLIPVLLSNLKLIGNVKDQVSTIFFWVGILVFDIVVSIMVSMNADEIKNLLIGQKPTLKIWQVPTQGEFWLIFVFGMLPLIVTHYLIESIVSSYRNSQPENVDAEKNKSVTILKKELIDLNSNKENLDLRFKNKNESFQKNADQLSILENELFHKKSSIDSVYIIISKNINNIYDVFISKIKSGNLFHDEILNSISTAYKSGFIQFLTEYYAEKEVARRVREVEQIIINNR